MRPSVICTANYRGRSFNNSNCRDLCFETPKKILGPNYIEKNTNYRGYWNGSEISC